MPVRFAQFLELLKPKRRWCQFTLSTMLLAVTLLCVWLADYVSPVRRLERQLRHPAETRRQRAAERLGCLGPEARSTTKSLLRATDDASSAVRPWATWALSRVSGRADLLEPLFSHSDPYVRLAAIEGWLWLGRDPTKLVALLKRNDTTVASDSGIFESLGPSQAAIVIPLLLDSLSADDPMTGYGRDPAALALNRIALPAPSVVPALIDRLGDKRPKVRTAVAEQLLRLGPSAQQAAPALRARLDDRDPDRAAACAAALGAIDPDDSEFLPVLKRALRHHDSAVAHRVAAYLWMLGPVAADASDDLVRFLYEVQQDAGLPYFDVNALKRLGPSAVSALDRELMRILARRARAPKVPQALREPLMIFGATVKGKLWSAFVDLRQTGTAATRSNDPLQTLVRAAKLNVLRRAMRLTSVLAMPESEITIPIWLGMVGPPAATAVPTLIAGLDDADFRYQVIRALGMIGKDAAPAVPRLLEFLDSDSNAVRESALWALDSIGVSDEASRARIRPFLETGNRIERALAAGILAASGEPPKQVLPVLLSLATNPPLYRGSLGQRWDCARRIAALGPAAVPGLILALNRRDSRVRDLAAEALGKLGPAAREAVPHLIALLDDPASWESVAAALGEIGPDAHPAVPMLVEMLKAPPVPPDELGDVPIGPGPPFDGLSEDDAGEVSTSDDDVGDASDDEDSDDNPYAFEYVTLLTALGGIGTDARAGATTVLKLANSNDPDIRHAAIQTLARIDPDHPALMRQLRRWLAEWERDSFDPWSDGLADTVWQLGPRAEPLAAGMNRLMTTAPLVDPQVRCYAAFALATFPRYRPAAVAYLEQVRKVGLSDSFDCINRADTLLQRITGVEQPWTKLVKPRGVGP